MAKGEIDLQEMLDARYQNLVDVAKNHRNDHIETIEDNLKDAN